MKAQKRNPPHGHGRAGTGAPVDNVDPDQPFRDTPSPDDPEDVGDLEEAFAGKKHGEGDYEAAKEYDKEVRSFVRSGKVERAAEQAKPGNDEEARTLAEAEQQGRSRSKGEDPASRGRKPG